MPARSRAFRSLAVVGLVALASSGCAFTQRASVDSAGNAGNGDSGDIDNLSLASPAMSGDGRYVAFESVASNLVAGDTNAANDVFLRDTRVGTTTRISVDSAGNQGNAGSYSTPALSADGRYVVFNSVASNLVAGDTNGMTDVFVRDTVAGTTTRLSVDSSGNQANGFSTAPTISADGRYVAFDSTASNLVAGDTNDVVDVFVRDRMAGTTTRVDVDGAGNQVNGGSGSAISADGHHVSFISVATTLVPGDTNGQLDVFARDLVSGTTSRVSVDSAGNQATGGTSGSSFSIPAISADGHFIAFSSWATNLVAGDTNDSSDVFLRDTVAGTTTRVSVDSAGNQAPYYSDTPVISADGRFVGFVSEGAPLVPGDNNPGPDVYVRDTVAGTTTEASVNRGLAQVQSDNRRPAMSTDGRYVAFFTDGHLVPEDTDGFIDVVVHAIPHPLVTSITPSTLPHGVATPVTITGSGFIPGSLVVVDGPGTSVSGITVVGPTQITATVTVAPDAPLTTRNVWVELAGTGPGVGAGAMGVCVACASVT